MTLYERYKEEFESGRAEGFSQGHQEGMKEGVKEGAKQEKLEIATNLIYEGADAGLIVKVTGLSLDDIERLRKEIMNKKS